MPGAIELQSVGAEQQRTPSGTAPAFDGWIFRTQATQSEVQAFYAGALGQQGWQPETYQVYPTSTDLRVWGWCKPARLFRLAILDPAAFSSTLSEGQAYNTLVHATVNGRTPDIPCPSH